jgi:hypothetical protein
MSSGNFITSRYEDDQLTIRPIRIQPETITTVNVAAAGTVGGDQVRVSGGNRRIGRKARSVTLKRFVGPVTEGVQAFKLTTIPILTFSVWDSLTNGASFDYDGATWFVAYKTKEDGITGR